MREEEKGEEKQSISSVCIQVQVSAYLMQVGMDAVRYYACTCTVYYLEIEYMYLDVLMHIHRYTDALHVRHLHNINNILSALRPPRRRVSIGGMTELAGLGQCVG